VSAEEIDDLSMLKQEVRHAPAARRADVRRAHMLGVSTFILCAVVRLAVIDRQSLWTDEFFSLAMATGHSVEHAANQADPLQGDYIESSGQVPSSQLARYLKHDPAPASPARVIRAVRLSDTNPPFYYLTVWGWTRAFGTSDWALRLLSTLFALGCFPLLWKLAKRFDSDAAVPACLLFTIAPLSIYYSTEGRMYTLVWFFVLGLTLISVELNERGADWKRMVLWVLSAAAGLYTHYFFAFPFAACVLWLLICPGQLPRRSLVAISFVTAILIFPWYVHVPHGMDSWRITKDWLMWRPEDFQWTAAPFRLAWSWLSNSDHSGLWDGGHLANRLAFALFAALVISLLWKLRWRAFAGKHLLLWLWIASVVAGPIAFDLFRQTYVSAVPRYAIAGMPAALLLVALGLAQLSWRTRIVTLLLAAAIWQTGIRAIYQLPSRAGQPIRELAVQVAKDDPDLLILHGIPSAITGFARYLPRDTPTLSWVGQLGVRHIPRDLASAIAGRHLVVLVDVHAVGAKTDNVDWLRLHAREIGGPPKPGIRIFRFVPPDGTTFAAR
jgi:uncharacterized membrane protein